MHKSFTGRVLFRNHMPAKDVEVRVFDKDEPGLEDDDLTINPGKSDEAGNFKVIYNPSLFRDMIPDSVNPDQLVPDMSDKYIPYARFTLESGGQKRNYTAPILPFRREYVLPESKPLDINPAVHAFAFPNSFPGYPLPFRLPTLPGIKEVSSIHGLCGGVSAAIYDFYLCGRTIPETREVPVKGTPLYRYLHKRQMQTYGVIGETVIKFAEWMLLPDQGPNSIQNRTYQSLKTIISDLDDGNAVLLGLVYVDWRNGFQIWNNHQVLTYGYSTSNNGLETTLHICDPNFPRNANVKIESQQVEIDQTSTSGRRSEKQLGVVSKQTVNGQTLRDVRGYFPIPYAQVIPPRNL